MRKFLLILAILSYAGSGFAQHSFYYTYFVENTPYMFLQDTTTFQKMEHITLLGMLGVNARGYPQKTTIDPNIYLRLPKDQKETYDSTDNTYWPIESDKEEYPYFLGFEKNQNVFLQNVSRYGNGVLAKFQVEQILFGINSEIVIKGLPIEDDSIVTALTDSGKTTFLVGSRQRRRFGKVLNIVNLDTSITIKKRIQSQIAIEKSTPHYGIKCQELIVSYQPFIYADRAPRDTLYAVMTSCYFAGVKTKGTLIVWDKEGKELFRSEKEGYYRIQGITDVDNNGINEIVLCNGSEWGCTTLELLLPQFDKERKNFRLIRQFKKVPKDFVDDDC